MLNIEWVGCSSVHKPVTSSVQISMNSSPKISMYFPYRAANSLTSIEETQQVLARILPASLK